MSIVLISGANKGIGEGFVKKYLSRPNTIVIGTVRNPNAADAQALSKVPAASGSKLILVKVESTSETDAKNAIHSLSSHKISHIDTVIANAGIFRMAAFQKVSEMKTSDLIEHVDVNAAGVVRLFQATLLLLQKAKKPIFMVVSSGAATIAGMEYVPFTLSSYGASKATINFLIRRIHFEQPELIAFAVNPGGVKTEGGNAAARFFGLPEAYTSVEDSVNGLLAKIDAASREETSGKFLAFDETPLMW